MTKIYLAFCWLMLHFTGRAQSDAHAIAVGQQNRQQVAKWLTGGFRFLQKAGEKKADLDSAETFGRQSMLLSQRIKYVGGFTQSVVLLALVGIERGTATTAHDLMNLVDDSTRADILLQLSAYYHHGGQLQQNNDSAASCLQKAMKIAMTLKNATLEFLARTRLFVQYCAENRSGAMMEQYQHIERLGPQLRKRYMMQFYLTATGALLKTGNYSLILKISFEGLKLSETEGNAEWFYSMLGRAYRQMNEPQKSIDAMEKAIALCKVGERIAPLWIYTDYIVKGLITLGRKEEALQRTLDTRKAIGITDLRDSINYYKLVSQCYRVLNRDKEAADVLVTLAQLVERNMREDPTTYLHLARIYYRSKEYDKATIYLQKTLNINNLAVDYKAETYRIRFWIDTATRNYPSAVKNLLMHQTLMDSIRNIEKENNVRQLMVQFETEKKDQDLILQKQSIDLLKQQTALREKDLQNAEMEFDYQMEERERNLQLAKMEASSKDKNIQLYSQNISLLKKDALLQQATISRNTFTRNMLIAGSVLMLTILLLLYSRYRLKQRNSSELAEKNLRLETLVKDKELLVKEVHHRVKNNLQTIISLLESQASFLSNDALAELQKSQGRVYAMSLIHHKLYQQDDITTVKMDAYFHELLTHIKSCFDLRGNIQVQETIEPLELAVSQAIPLGLILNEAITNAIKYAFPNNRPGLISVSLKATDNDLVLLQVIDNGIGLPQNWDQQPRQSLGITLMRGLCGDIHGECSISSSGGTCVDVSFPKTLGFLSN